MSDQTEVPETLWNPAQRRIILLYFVSMGCYPNLTVTPRGIFMDDATGRRVSDVEVAYNLHNIERPGERSAKYLLLLQEEGILGGIKYVTQS